MIENEKKLVDSMKNINLSTNKKEKILRQVLNSKFERNSFMGKNLKIAIPIALCCFFLVGAFILPNVINSKTPQPTVQIPASDTPEPRKFMIYNGQRYAFVENGKIYKLDTSKLIKDLGTLTYDIMADIKNHDTVEYASKDFATTFALGGTIHEISYYDPAFRVVVKLDENFYLAENVDSIGEDSISASEYFKISKLQYITEKVEIYDHIGSTVLDTLDKKDAEDMINALSESLPIKDFSNEEYEEMARAQSNGESFLLSFILEDNTSFKMFVIPKLKVASIGDNLYYLSENFLDKYSEDFIKLERPTPIPLY